MIGKLFRFWLAGLPSFLVAIPLNYALVTYAHAPKPLAYLIVLFCQVTINFFACRKFVFKTAPGASVWHQYTEFLVGIGLFRVLDWLVYVALVQFVGISYLVVQVLNVVVFSLMKYTFSERLFQRDRSAKGPGTETASAMPCTGQPDVPEAGRQPERSPLAK